MSVQTSQHSATRMQFCTLGCKLLVVVVRYPEESYVQNLVSRFEGCSNFGKHSYQSCQSSNTVIDQSTPGGWTLTDCHTKLAHDQRAVLGTQCRFSELPDTDIHCYAR